MEETLIASYRLQGPVGEMQAHSHKEYEIYVFHEGTCRYLIHNQIYDLQPGDILLMDGLALHKPNVPKDSVYVRSHVHFTPDLVLPVLEAMGAVSLLDVFDQLHHCLIRPSQLGELQQVETLIHQIVEVERLFDTESYEKTWELKTLVVQLLIVVNQLGQRESHKVMPDKMDKARHAENIAAFIQGHFHEKLSIQKIADTLNVSRFYVSHVFKEMTGYTVMEYVMAVRLQQVKYLLEMDTDKSMQQIADQCGFESASHFSRFFKQSVGMTAKQYRKQRLQIYHSVKGS
ncbi:MULTISPECIES: helix-turn-helix transcriptional regulator [Gracilibacillus]|uniref:helix-turn-helix transcriptional regulator n=1 Tax=Gracilibacillus TaxID=74385 RepID=UPI000825893D|nr:MULTISPECIES: helix-turn-helix domain-containing protein [Gracilibacillus]